MSLEEPQPLRGGGVSARALGLGEPALQGARACHGAQGSRAIGALAHQDTRRRAGWIAQQCTQQHGVGGRCQAWAVDALRGHLGVRGDMGPCLGRLRRCPASRATLLASPIWHAAEQASARRRDTMLQTFLCGHAYRSSREAVVSDEGAGLIPRSAGHTRPSKRSDPPRPSPAF